MDKHTSKQKQKLMPFTPSMATSTQKNNNPVRFRNNNNNNSFLPPSSAAVFFSFYFFYSFGLIKQRWNLMKIKVRHCYFSDETLRLRDEAFISLMDYAQTIFWVQL